MTLPVSVVIPCFRCAATIQRTAESVLSQTQLPAEAVLVDDGSDDGTAQALERVVGLLQTKMRVQLIRLPSNRGVASARNAGWEAAGEEYVAFLDADATWFPRKLEVQYRFMEQHPKVALSGHLHVIGDELARAGEAQAVGSVTLGFMDFLWKNRFTTSSAMLRRSAPLRFNEGQRHMEDHRLWLDIARTGLGIARIELRLSAHHKPDFGASGLSADLLAMEKAELGNYRAVFRAGAIGAGTYRVLLAWSFLKFVRRLVNVAFRRLAKVGRNYKSPD